MVDSKEVQYKKAGVSYEMPFTYNEQNNSYIFDSGTDGFWPLESNEEHFGMKMTIDFMQPVNGKLDENTDMTFSFSGDDDLWVFIDGKLALDLGGIHGIVSGTINFADKMVIYDNPVENGDANEVHSNWTRCSLDDGKIGVPFASLGLDLTEMNEHEMKIFYLERGGWNSNCKIQFNLLRFTGNPNLLKIVEGNTAFLDLQKKYTFQVLKKEGEAEVPFSNQQYTVNGMGKDISGEVYTTDSEGKLQVKAADIVAFDVDAGTQIQMKEVLSDEEQNKYATTVHVEKMDGKKATILGGSTGINSDFYEIPAVESGKVNYIFTNSLKETGDLSITKKLAAKNDGKEFQFQVYFKNNVKENGMVKQMAAWTLYTGSYTVADKDCQAKDGVIQLSADETAIIKDIPVDTEYFVTEVLDSDSYTVKEELQTVVAAKDGEAADSGNTIVESGALPAGTTGLAGKIKEDENANAVTITNMPVKEQVAIRGQKTWKGDAEVDRPETITIHIMNGNDVAATTTSSVTMDWKYEVSGLQKYDANGQLIRYTVKEAPISGYVAEIEQPVMTDELDEYVVDITNVKPSVLSGMINLAKRVEGDIAKASTNKFAFRLTLTIDNEEANAEEEVNNTVAQTVDAEYENALDTLRQELETAWEDVLTAVDSFKAVCAEIMPEANEPLPEAVKTEEAAAKQETVVDAEAAETQVAATEDAALENGVDETTDAGVDTDLTDEAENALGIEDAATEESTNEDGSAEAAVEEEETTADESNPSEDSEETPEEAAVSEDTTNNDVVTYSTESYSMVARALNSIEFKVMNGEGNVTANAIVGRLAALLSQNEISDEEATEQLSLVLMLALDQENLDDVEREEALAVIADTMVEMPADQAAYTPEQLQSLYQAVEEILEKYEIYQERKAEQAAIEAAYMEPVRLYDGMEMADPVAATPSAIQLVLSYSNGKKDIVELNRQGNGAYVYEGIELMDRESVGIDVKATTGSAINFTITETETGDAKTVDFQQGTTTWMETTSVNGRIAPGQSVRYTAINTFDPKEEAEDPETPKPPVEPIPEETKPTTPEPSVPETPIDDSDVPMTEPDVTDEVEPTEPDVEIDDPDVPLAEPDVADEIEPIEPTEPAEPEMEIFDLNVPLGDMPGEAVEEAVEIDEPQVPLHDAPQTGDASKALPFVVLMMVAGCGLIITGKRFN